jgi:hypothetical protein
MMNHDVTPSPHCIHYLKYLSIMFHHIHGHKVNDIDGIDIHGGLSYYIF